MNAQRLGEVVKTVWTAARAYPLLTLVLVGIFIVTYWLGNFLFGGFISLGFSLLWTLVKLVYYSPLLYIFTRGIWIIVRRVLRRYNKQNTVEALLYQWMGWIRERFFTSVQGMIFSSLQTTVANKEENKGLV
jgi:hypothetical protein